MKKSFLFLMLLCFACFGAARAEIVEIGDEGTTNNQYLPGYNFYNYSLTQQIYTADEIGMAGTINSIAFKNTAALKTRNYHVYMLHTDKETFANDNDWVAMSDNDLVFSGELSFAVDEWTTIELDTPFAYDGSSNLIVGVSDVTGSYTSSPHMACLVFGASQQALRSYRDGSAYDITAPNVTGTIMDVKNQIQLDITPSGTMVCTKPTLAVSDITSSGATLTWGGGSGTYNVQLYQDGYWNAVMSNTTSTSFRLSGLSPLTAYEARVQSVCSGGNSDWRTVSFSTTAVATEVGDAWADDFEGNACGWELINSNLTNAWVWGTAANNGGSRGLYISNDNGTTNAYTITSATTVYATKLLHFTEGKFEFSYDWMANGEANTNNVYDYLRVALVPASVTLTAGTTVPSGFGPTALPSGWIAVDGGSHLNSISTWQNNIAAVNVTTGNFYMVVVWRNDGSQGNQPPAAIDNVSITRLACAYDVTGLEVENITTNSATLIWDDSGATQWQVAYADNAGFENATEEIVDYNSLWKEYPYYSMTGLRPSSYYFAKVRTYCGGSDFGAWSSVLSFSTDCETLTDYPYTEDFDQYTINNALPICWNKINTSSSNYAAYPKIYNYSYHSGPNCLYFYSYYSSYDSYDPQDQYAILPEMENLAGKQITLYAKGNSSLVTIKIGMMTDPADASTFTEISTETLTTEYKEIICFVPSNANANHIAIMLEAANQSSPTRFVHIDDITIDIQDSCLRPNTLTMDENSTTAHGASFSWTLYDATQTAWDIQVATDYDFSQDVRLIENVGTHEHYALTGLDPETDYYVRVRSNCGSGDVSEWSNIVYLRTTQACPTPTSLTVSELGSNSVMLNWTGSSESYNVMYRTPTQTIGFNEPFNTNSVPSGWTKYYGLLNGVLADSITLNTTSTGWSPNSIALGSYNMKLNIYGSSCKYWLVTPEVTVSNNYSLNFDLALTDFNNANPIEFPDAQADDRFVVLVYADGNWTILREWNNSGSDYVFNTIATTGESVSINLSAYVGKTVKIAFYGESTVGGASSGQEDNDLHIDNVGIGIFVAAGAWQTIVVDEAPAIITGLTPETTYEVKVQGNCGDDGQSLETNVLSFTTLEACPTPTALTANNITGNTAELSWTGSIDLDSYTVRYRVAEHIEGGINEEFGTSLPAGWENKTGLLSNVMEGNSLATGNNQWAFGSSNGVFDDHARINIYGNSRYGWLITPAFTLASSTFSFDLALTAYSGSGAASGSCEDDRFVVLISTDNETTWTILREWNNSGAEDVYNDIPTAGEIIRIDLSDYVGQKVRIAFYGESTINSNGDNNLHIDNVIIGEPTVVPASAWQTASASTTEVTLSGLTPETTYEAQVKSDCSDPEVWSDAITFTTPILTTLTQIIELEAGSNWFSTYVEITLDDLKAALLEAVPNTEITIQGQKNNIKYNPNNHRWTGRLTSLDLSNMYKISVEADGEITLEGMPIDPADHPVTISFGANWIAYPLNESMSPTNAFAGFAQAGDKIQSQKNNANYNGTRWSGRLTVLDPGQGFIYHSTQSETRILTFPSSK